MSARRYGACPQPSWLCARLLADEFCTEPSIAPQSLLPKIVAVENHRCNSRVTVWTTATFPLRVHLIINTTVFDARATKTIPKHHNPIGIFRTGEQPSKKLIQFLIEKRFIIQIKR